MSISYFSFLFQIPFFPTVFISFNPTVLNSFKLNILLVQEVIQTFLSIICYTIFILFFSIKQS